MKYKIINRAFASSVITLAIALFSPAAAGATASITGPTGPDSFNSVTISNKSTNTTTNNNNINISNLNNQTAVSGNVDIFGNTTAGSARSGNATNNNSTNISVNINNNKHRENSHSTGSSNNNSSSTMSGGQGSGSVLAESTTSASGPAETGFGTTANARQLGTITTGLISLGMGAFMLAAPKFKDYFKW